MIDAMKQALEALNDRASLMRWQAAREALHTAIAEAEKQEPVAMRYDFDGYGYKYIDSGSGSDWQTRHKGAEPLYEAPPKQEKQEPCEYCKRGLMAGVCTCKQEKQEPVASVHIKDGCLTGSHRKEGAPFPDGHYGLWPIESHPAPPPQEKQEPVAWMNDSTPAGVFARHKQGAENFGCTIPLYTAPPQRQPLTEEEIALISAECALVTPSDIYFARAIERKHGIGAAMSEQPEALRLADLMSAMDYEDTKEAAAELRRLHSVNAQLLEELEAAVTYFDAPSDGCFSDASLTKARAAIAAAKGEA